MLKLLVNLTKQLTKPQKVINAFKIFLRQGPVGLYRKLKGVNLIVKFDSQNQKSFQEWIDKTKPTKESLEQEKRESKNFAFRPLISLITPVYNTKPALLKETIKSVMDQSYDNWEICLVDGNPKNRETAAILKKFNDGKQIKTKLLEKNLGISGNTNEALKIASGEYVGFLDHDDLLEPNALFEIVKLLNTEKNVDLIYTDQDKISEDSDVRFDPFFKPSWSPDLFNSLNYFGHFVVVKLGIVQSVGMLHSEYDGAQDYDLWLRIVEKTSNIFHLPRILYHWRVSSTSTAGNITEAKNYADDAGKKAVIDHLKRVNIDAVVENTGLPTFHRVRYPIAGNPLISIIIPFKDKPQLLEKCVGSIMNLSSYSNFELILVSNNSVEEKTKELLKKLEKINKVQIRHYDKPFNYSKVNNWATQFAKGEYLLFLNNDTEVLTSDWLQEMLGFAQQDRVGAVGCLLLFPNKTIQHAGVIVGIGGYASHVFSQLTPDTTTPFGFAYWPRNYLAVTAACLMVKKIKFEEVGKFDEKFIICGNDVDLGLKLYSKGYLNVYTPFSQLFHYESATRSSKIPENDFNYSKIRYKKFLEIGDPYYNPNLSLEDDKLKINLKI